METVTGKIVSVKEKTARDGTDYEGVTLVTDDGAKFWFGNYGPTLIAYKGKTVRVEAGSTADGNNITFLNKVKNVSEVARSARPKPQTPVATPDPTGWEDDEPAGEPEPVSAAAPMPGPIGEPTHRVTENAAPIGTVDDLAEGTDPSRYGGSITFRKGVMKSEVEFLLRALAGVLDTSDIREYDGKEGSPVFYIP